MRILRSLSLLAVILSFSGCVRDMDPFEGGDGVRVNINGQKCVMLGIPGGYYATLDTKDDECLFQSEVAMMTGFMSRNQDIFKMIFDIRETDILVKDKKYTVNYSGNKVVKLMLPNDDASSYTEVMLKGWISFLSLGQVVEARFELEGRGPGGVDYSLRHGFLRLHQQAKKQ
ncbi:MAG: hypothetical protein IKR38_09105 [Bacteroidales bacterium]|nr:hypothetical protein [Bacteroidales bacterium]